ncbi:MAG: stalk domain-containing protein [Clostridia bacterium]|nr:stalk domain-containing protein [Clostridia bacterium]
MDKKKFVSFATSAALIVGTLSPTVFAAPSYVEDADKAAKAKTEELYASRPVVLRQLEYLKRGVVAVKSDNGTLVSWRFLGTDATDIAFNVYRDGVKLNSSPISNKTNYFDEGAPSSAAYTVVPVSGGQEVESEKESATTWNNEYLSVPVSERTGYDINDVTVGDLDGDGEYELVVRRNPPTMDIKARGTNYPIIEAYKLDGTRLWTIDVGPNEINDIDINFLVYDFNQDGKAEMVMRSFEGTVDGTGAQIGDANGDGKTDYSYSIQSFPDRQYLSEGPEFLSMYDGMTGKEIARTDLVPTRDPLSGWAAAYTDTARLTKRASHHLLAVAYLDGITPAITYVRGAWDAVKAAAWDIKNNNFNHLWTIDCPSTNALDNLYNSGYHSMAVADVDFDGKDELLSGSFCIDNDGSFVYAAHSKDSNGNWVKMGHGDAFDVAMMDPDFKGYYVWACQENKNMPVNIGLHDARTGQVLFGYPKEKDTGRARAADIDPTSRGWEVWGSTGTQLQSIKGEVLVDSWNSFKYKNKDGSFAKNADTGEDLAATLPMNFKIYWDGDLLSELQDDITISKYDWENKTVNTLVKAEGCVSNLGTKAEPCLTADIFGDWREETIYRTADNKEMRIYSTNIPTNYKIPTLMHDWTYREAVAWQNNHYNQPTNVSFYMGAETTEVPVPEMYTVHNGTKTINPVYAADSKTHAFIPVLSENKSASSSVVLKIGSPKAIKGGEIVSIDSSNENVTPVIADGRTLVPLRFLSETFGADVAWDGTTQTITITKDDKVIVMVINQNSFTVNGEEKTLDVPAQIMNERTMVPIRAVLEAFGKQLFWDARGIIVIDDAAPSPDDATISDWLSKL